MTSDFRPDSVSSPVVQKPSVTTSPRPKDGSQPSRTEKTKMSKMPEMKLGTETPTTDIVISERASRRSRRAAA